VIFSTLGSIIGSLISYYIGKYGGNPLVKKYGKYVLLDEHDLEKTEKWFGKRGERTIFISRFIPVVRHLISIPAGIGKMNIWKFSIYTIFGAAMWNAFLAYLGYILGENWESVRKYSEYISISVAMVLIICCIYFLRKHIQNKKNIGH
jgi:membrane protein DedA with SNARE-associated domain